MNYYMDDRHRELTPDELRIEIEAMKWLKEKGFSIPEIMYFGKYRINEENKTIPRSKRFGFLIIRKEIPYADTPLEAQITQAVEVLKSSIYIFPRWAWKGRKPQPVMRTWTEAEIFSFLCLQKKKRHIFVYNQVLRRGKKQPRIEFRV